MRHPYVIALIWVSMNLNVLSFSTGMVAPDMGFEFRYFSYTTLGFLIGWAIFPAAFTIFGHKLGMRQMVHARYSFGYFGAPVPALLTALTGLGYGILNAIVAGETLQAVSPHGSMSATVGIVIVTVMALAVSFCGIRVLNVLDMVFWLPVLISFRHLGRRGQNRSRGTACASSRAASVGAQCFGFGFFALWLLCVICVHVVGYFDVLPPRPILVALVCHFVDRTPFFCAAHLDARCCLCHVVAASPCVE